MNPAYYFGPDARQPFEADYAGSPQYCFQQFQTIIDDADLVLHGPAAVSDPPAASQAPHHHYVGPLLWESSGQAPTFLDEPGSPWVLGTLSPVPQPAEIALARAALIALVDESMRVVITLRRCLNRAQSHTRAISSNYPMARMLPTAMTGEVVWPSETLSYNALPSHSA